MPTYKQLSAVRSKNDDELFKLPNVVGIASGLRVKNGEPTDERVVIVCVEEKLPRERLSAEHLIPQEIEAEFEGEILAVGTDVVQTGAFKLGSNETKDTNYDRKIRPVQPGYSIGGNPDGYFGTVGIFLVDTATNQAYILSNNHVLVEANKFAINVIQPDGGSPSDKIGKTWTFVEYDLKGTNYMDAAIASIDDYNLVTPEYPQFGRILGAYESVKVGWDLRKIGAATGLTTAKVYGIDYKGYAESPVLGKLYFEGQTIITSPAGTVAAGGDSGAIAITMDNYAGLLIYSGSGNFAIGTPMGSILKTFQMSIWSNRPDSGQLIPVDDEDEGETCRLPERLLDDCRKRIKCFGAIA